MNDWRPSADIEVLRQRAEMLAGIRAFFRERDVLEVQTPVLSRAGTTDPAIESLICAYDGPGTTSPEPLYLQTSPEFFMKRLLAAGSGSIYQVGPAFRQGEAGRFHNPEFTMLEWYRTGMDYHELMVEVDELVRSLIQPVLPLASTRYYRYDELFSSLLAIDVHAAGEAELRECLHKVGVDVSIQADLDRDSLLDLLMTSAIEPSLPTECPVFVYDYPASQASLAEIDPGPPAVARRFELYINGLELANGFQELRDFGEQRKRFIHDAERRANNCQRQMPGDDLLLWALESGLPECAGVALGLDRLLLTALGKEAVADVMAFPFSSI